MRNYIQGINSNNLLSSHMLKFTFYWWLIFLFPDLITNSEMRRPICMGSIVIWFSERFNLSSRVNEENVVKEIEVIEFRRIFNQTRFGGSCDENCFNLLLSIHSSLKWRSDEISSGNSVNRFDDKLRNWSWVSLLIWFEMCVIWLKMRFKCVRFERQYKSDGMKRSLLFLNERCLSFVIIHTSDGIVSMLSLFNSNTSSLIQFFILNGILLICVVPLNLNSLKLSNIPILLECYWENYNKIESV
jgi:hypothetical protein